MAIASVALASLGLIATAFVGWLVHKKTSKLLKRINAIQIAQSTPSELKHLKRLIDDIERTGEKRGTVAQTLDGTWKIDWTPLDGTKL